jgi:hypothetical protein
MYAGMVTATNLAAATRTLVLASKLALMICQPLLGMTVFCDPDAST